MNWHSLILDALKVLVVLLLVMTNGFFVAAEFALVRIRETQLDALVARGQRGARMARHIVHNLNSYLSATQLGITMASLGLGYIGEPVFAALTAWIWSGERWGIRTLSGAALILTAILFVELKPSFGQVHPQN